MNERDFNCADAESDAPIIDCPRLLIQYIRSHLPHLEAFFSISNLRTRHDMRKHRIYEVTGNAVDLKLV
jgi:hypothetical protein